MSNWSAKGFMQPVHFYQQAMARPLVKGATLKIASVICFMVMNSLIKQISQSLPIGEIVLARNLFGLIPVLFLLRGVGGLAALKTVRPWQHFRRGAFGIAGMFTGFLALSLLPIADATVLQFSAPIITGFLAVPMLGEAMNHRRMGAIIIGFIGTLVILQPVALISGIFGATEAGGLSKLGLAAGLAWGIFTGLAMISISQMNEKEPGYRIVFYFFALGIVCGGLSLFYQAQWPSASEWMILLFIGLSGGLAQLLMTYAYQAASPSIIMPFDYLSLVLAIIIGLVFFNEIPSVWTWVGAGLVTLSGIAIIMITLRGTKTSGNG